MSIYAVNGKIPTACWIPSLDTGGNGTNTLTDLVGSSNVTLNLALTGTASNWVANSDSGGTRAIALDGIDDFGFGSNPLTTAAGSVSMWLLVRNIASTANVFAFSHFNGGNRVYINPNSTAGIRSNTVGLGATQGLISSTPLLLNTWYCCTLSWNGSTASMFLNGSQVGSATAYSGLTVMGSTINLGRVNAGGGIGYMDGLIDDIRTTNVAIDLTDHQYLWFAGNGRARLASSDADFQDNHALLGC
jgi:hypothetical protein